MTDDDSPGTTRDQAIEVMRAMPELVEEDIARALADAGLLRGGGDTGDEARRERDAMAAIMRHDQLKAEVDRLEGLLSSLLMELTGGRMSNTTYDVPTMVREIESHFDDEYQNAVAEAVKLRVERDQLLGRYEAAKERASFWCDADFESRTRAEEAEADRDRAVADLAALRGRVEKLADSTETSCDFTYGGVCVTHQCDVEDYRGMGRRECALVASIRALDGGQA